MTSTDTDYPATAPSLWRNRDFWLLWSGQAVSQLGTQISTLALPLLVLSITGAPLQAGIIAAVQRAPYLILGLPAGALVDRWDRRVVMVTCDTVRFLTYGSIPVVAWLGSLHLVQFYLVALVGGATHVLFDVADNASFPRVIPPVDLPRAVSAMESTNAAVGLLGPGLGGVLVGVGRTIVGGVTVAYAVDSLSYLASALSLLKIHAPFQAERNTGEHSSVRDDIVVGLRYLRARSLLGVLAVYNMVVIMLGGPASLAVIVLARDIRADVHAIGLIFAVGGVGGLIGAAIMPWVRARFRVGQILLGSVVVWLLSMVVLALADSVAMLMVGWAVNTLSIPVYFTTLYAYRTTLVPDELQGRVNSVFRLMAYIGSTVGPVAGGVLLGPLGPRALFALIACGLGICVLIVGLTSVRNV